MARLIPDYSEEQLQGLKSHAEATVYRAARSRLGSQYLVLHGTEWILRHEDAAARDGEADFLICNPKGLIVLEIKGGGVSFDPAAGQWFSVDSRGERHEIKDPFRQAKDHKFAVLEKLKEHPGWSKLRLGRILIGHAVLIPDLQDVTSLISPKSPREIVGSRLDLQHFAEWIESVFTFWRGENDALNDLGSEGLALVEEVFARPLEVRPLLFQHLADEESMRVRLTEQQAKILSVLGRRRRVAICGGAGTGKTILALEKARRLSREGFRTLLLCYNRPLADYLASLCPKLTDPEVMSYHQLCSSYVNRAQMTSGRPLFAEAAAAYPRADVYDVQWPLALAYATEILSDRFDAVVVDEGQDFREEYWLPIELLLADLEKSPLYVFYDQNQALYTRVSSFPVRDEPFVLTTNCRNTQHIHRAAYQFFRGEETSPSTLTGLEIERVIAPFSSAQAGQIHRLICSLLTSEKVKADDIVILIGDARFKQSLASLLNTLPLPGGKRWALQEHGRTNTVLIETVLRFKGLESAVVILWGLDTLSKDEDRELLYVGRKRHAEWRLVADA